MKILVVILTMVIYSYGADAKSNRSTSYSQAIDKLNAAAASGSAQTDSQPKYMYDSSQEHLEAPQEVQVNSAPAEMSGACKEEYDAANKACNKSNWATTAFSALQSAAGGAAPTNAYSACKALKFQSATAAVGTVGIRTSCVRAATSCVNTCNSNFTAAFQQGHTLEGIADRKAQTSCSGFISSANKGMVLGLATAGAGLEQGMTCSQLIASVNSGACAPGASMASTPTCATICASTPALCVANVNCTNPAQANSPTCLAQGSNGVEGHGFTPPSVGTDTTEGNFDETAGGFKGYNPTGAPSGKFGANDAASGGGGGGGAAPYPGGAPGAQGGGGSGGGYNKDIEHGYGGGSGGGGWPSGGSGAEGGLAAKNGGDPALDLSKFLPGGEMDPAKRDLASVDDLRGQGITGANELSNFEKVTRMMNKKRTLLKAGDGK